MSVRYAKKVESYRYLRNLTQMRLTYLIRVIIPSAFAHKHEENWMPAGKNADECRNILSCYDGNIKITGTRSTCQILWLPVYRFTRI